MSPELLSALDLRINDVPMHPSAARDADGHVITAGVPLDVIRAPGESNVIAIQLPTVVRPCDLDRANPDSRLLGIAVHRIELMAVCRAARGGAPRGRGAHSTSHRASRGRVAALAIRVAH